MKGFCRLICVILIVTCTIQAKPATKEVSKQCKEPIGIQTGFLEDRDVKTSSASKNFTVHDAWCAGTNDAKQFFAADLGEDFLLTKIATQGKVDDKNRYVKTYELQFSSDNKKWVPYFNEGKQILEGNKDTFTVKYHKLDPDTVGRYVKILPKTWNNGICSRMELYGCSVEDLQKEKTKSTIPLPPPAAVAATKEVPKINIPASDSKRDTVPAPDPKRDTVPVTNSKQDSEATWKFLAGDDTATTGSDTATTGSDNADLLELTKQLGAQPPQ